MSFYKNDLYRNLAVIFALFTALLLQQAWVPGFFHDGYLYAAFGKNAAELGHWLVPHVTDVHRSRFFQHMPFVFALEGVFFKIFGASYVTARIFVSLFALGSLLALFRITSKQNKSWGYFSCVFFILIPPLLKKARFPNLDIPLMFWVIMASVFYLRSFKTGKVKYWLLTGFFFGLCLLTKGPMAVFIPLSILFHLLIEKKLKILLSPLPWIGLLFGAAIFSIWPFLLYQTGNWDIFKNYIQFTFLDTMRDGRGTPSPFYTYFVFLLKYTGLWLICSFFTIYKIMKKDYGNTELKFFTALFFAILLPLSFFKFKYSHYLLPIYPALAALASYPLVFASERFIDNFKRIFRILAFLTPLTLLVFPLTTQIRRDVEIFKIREITKLSAKLPKKWAIINGVYPYWGLLNLNAFEDHSDTYQFSGAGWWKKLKGEEWGVLIDSDHYETIKNHLNGRFFPLIKFNRKNMLFLIETNLVNKKYPIMIK